MYLLAYILVGVISGWVASTLMQRETIGSVFRDVAVGIMGALFGGFIFDFIGNYVLGFWDSIGTAIIGAVLFLFILAQFTFPRTHSRKTSKRKYITH